MRKKTQLCLCLSLVLAGAMSLGQHTHTSSEFDRADGKTVRLPPDAFDDLPGAVQEELTVRGCTIPQPFHRGLEKRQRRSRAFH